MDSIGPIKLKSAVAEMRNVSTDGLSDSDSVDGSDEDGDAEHPVEHINGEVKIAAMKHLSTQEALLKEQKAMENARDAYVALDSKLDSSKKLEHKLNAALHLSGKLQRLVELCKRQEHEAFNVHFPVVGATDGQKEKIHHLRKVCLLYCNVRGRCNVMKMKLAQNQASRIHQQ